MIYGAILAGGNGTRVESHPIPKQFISIGHTPVIVLTLQQFVKNDRLDLIYTAVLEEWIEYAGQIIRANFSEEERQKIRIVKGGKERLDSFVNIMNHIMADSGLNEEDILICHDAVRPFLSQQMLNDCIDGTLKDGAALTVIPVNDTIHISKREGYIDGTLDRTGLFNGQTPSGFNMMLLKNTLDHVPEDEKQKVTGTTQLLVRSGHSIKLVKGHTGNFKITTDHDLDVAERLIKTQPKKRKIELLDCTLRDGGIVIDFCFGTEKMKEIQECIEASGIEYIECGYIDEKKGKESGYTCFDSERAIERTLLKDGKKPGVTYVAMIDYGTFDVRKLSPCGKNGIDGLRLAFHKEACKEAVEAGRIILEKGYDLYIQPMVSTRYDNQEFCKLIQICNSRLGKARGFYVVDSFGQMDNLMITEKLKIADQYVAPTMKIGFHAHNNRQMAYSNALAVLTYPSKHDIMLDSSIMGMGKGAGNLCTELIASSLCGHGKEYKTTGIYDLISNYFSKVWKDSPWGYSLDFYLSSLYSCTPSYIKIFQRDNRVTTDDLILLLKTIPSDKKTACDRDFAENHLQNYFGDKRKGR